MRIQACLILLLALLLGGCAALEPAQPPTLNIADSHLFGVTRLAFDPSGRHIASAGFKGDMAVWAVPAGRMIHRLHWHHSPVRGLVWLGDGRLLSAEESGDLVVTDLAEGSVAVKRETRAGLTSLAYLAQPSLVVAGYADGQLRAFDYPDLQPVKQLALGAEVVAMVGDRGGARLAVSTDDRRVRLLDRQLEEVRRLDVPSATALELRFSPDDRELAAGAWYKLFYWDLTSGRVRAQETEHWGAVTSIDYHPDGQRLISLGRHTDANLRLVTTDAGTVLRRLQGHRLCGAAVRISPDGRYVVSGSDDESIRFYDLSTPYRPQRVGDSW